MNKKSIKKKVTNRKNSKRKTVKKKGFTLIELIGTIVLISMLALIIAPAANRVVKKGKIVAEVQQEENVLLAGRNWGGDHKNLLPDKGTIRDISIEDLQAEGYLDKGIKKISTGELLTGCIRITNASNSTNGKQKYVYTYFPDLTVCIIGYDGGETNIEIKAKEVINGVEQTNEYNGNWTKNPIKLIANVTSNGQPIQAPKYIWRKGTGNDQTTTTTNTKLIQLNKEEGQFSYFVSTNGTNYYGPKNLKIDTKAPTITATKSPDGAKDKIHFTIEDHGSGVAGYQLTTNKNAPTNWTNVTNNPTKYEDEVNELSGVYYVWAKDSAGNISLPMKVAAKPRCEITLSGDKGEGIWYRSNVTVTVNQINGTNLTSKKLTGNGQTSTTGVLTHSAETASVTYTAEVTNAAGTGTCTATFKVDKTKPTCTVTPSGTTSGGWYTEDATITLTRQDSGTVASGVASAYDFTTSATATYNQSSTNSSITATQGNTTGVTYYGYVKDKAGNTNSCHTSTIKVDKTKPTASIETTATLKATSQTATLKCSDSGSKVKSYYWGTSAPTTSSTYTSITATDSMSVNKTVNAAGTYYLACKDTAGHVSTTVSKVYRSYTVKNMLQNVSGSTYTTTDYTQTSSATYVAPKGTTLTLASIYSIPNGSRAGRFVGISSGSASTTAATPSKSDVTLNSNATYTAWFTRNVLYFKYKTNGGTLTAKTTSSDGANTYKWATDSDGYITRSTNGGTATSNFYSYRYGVASIDLANYNNTTYLNITKSGYVGKSGAEWLCESGCKTSGKTLTHNAYNLTAPSGGVPTDEICDAKSSDCTIVVKVNWQMPAPKCSITLSGTVGENSWYKSNVTVTMTIDGTATSKGLATTQNSTNGSTSVTHSTEGSSITYYGYVANAGGSNTCSKTFKMDKTAPGVPTSTIRYDSASGSVRTNANSWTNRTLWWGSFSATDTGTSGVNHYEYSTNCTGTKSGNLSSSYTYDTDRNWQFCIRSVDNAGNASAWSGRYYFMIDKTKPTCKLAVTSGSTCSGADGRTWYTSNVVIKLQSPADTGGSGLNTGSYKVAGTANQYTLSSDGKDKTITGTLTDNAGNQGSCTLKVSRDTANPTISRLAGECESWRYWYHYRVADSTSGIYSRDLQHTYDTSCSSNWGEHLSESGLGSVSSYEFWEAAHNSYGSTCVWVYTCDTACHCVENYSGWSWSC